MLEIVAGWDPREVTGYNVCKFSARRRTSRPIQFRPLMEKALRFEGLYTRPHEQRNGQLWDVISDAPMATSFANSRFLAPWLATGQWVLSCDCADQMFLADPAELFALGDDKFAVQVVKHNHVPNDSVKMDDQIQTVYPRKNWSSVILWNLDHPSNVKLTLDMVNTLPGRDLHRFCWLADDEIGELPAEWNWLVGIDPSWPPPTDDPDVFVDASDMPKLLHFTEGAPFMPGYENGPWADVWQQELAIMDATRGSSGGI